MPSSMYGERMPIGWPSVPRDGWSVQMRDRERTRRITAPLPPRAPAPFFTAALEPLLPM